MQLGVGVSENVGVNVLVGVCERVYVFVGVSCVVMVTVGVYEFVTVFV